MTITQDVAATIAGLEEERLAAMVAADVDTLDRILADDLSYVHTTAAIDTKESLTSGLASPGDSTMSQSRRRWSGRSERTAILPWCEAERTCMSTAITSRWSILWCTSTTDGDWQMTSWHATRLP